MLTPATTSLAPQRVEWMTEMDAAFRSVCKSLCERVVLHVPCVCDLLVLYMDASNGKLGKCLHVIRGEEKLLVAFFSRPAAVGCRKAVYSNGVGNIGYSGSSSPF